MSFLIEKVFANLILPYLSSDDLLVARQVCKSWSTYIDQLSPRCQHLLFLKPVTDPTDMRHFDVLNAEDSTVPPTDTAFLNQFGSTAFMEGNDGWLHLVQRVINPFLRCATVNTAPRTASSSAIVRMVPMKRMQKSPNLHIFSDDTKKVVVMNARALDAAHPEALWKRMYFSQPPLKRIGVSIGAVQHEDRVWRHQWLQIVNPKGVKLGDIADAVAEHTTPATLQKACKQGLAN